MRNEKMKLVTSFMRKRFFFFSTCQAWLLGKPWETEIITMLKIWLLLINTYSGRKMLLLGQNLNDKKCFFFNKNNCR